MTDFWTVINTPSFIPRLMHVFAAAGTAGSALMVSVSAWYVLKKRNVDLAKSNLKLALPLFILFAFANLFIFGPNMAIEVTHNQPLKLASMEGLWQSTSCAPMYFLGWVDVATQTTTGLHIPCLLSFLAYQDVHATVAGIDSFAPAPIPPINLLFQVYHVMINLAPLLAGIGFLAGIWYLWKRRIYQSRFVLWLLVLTVFMAEIAITSGWWTAEIGRQPWVVYNVLATADGVSPLLSGVDVALTLGLFIGLYAIAVRAVPVPVEPQDPGRTGTARGRGDGRGVVATRHLPGDLPQAASRCRPATGRGRRRITTADRTRSHRGRTRRCPARPMPRLLRGRGGQAMSLADIWYALFILIVAGYLILDGFDLGVGILHLPVARTDLERRTIPGQHRSGLGWQRGLAGADRRRPVRLLPARYASLFSGFYLAFMLVLVCLILRAVVDRVPQQGAQQPLAFRLGRGVRMRLAGPRAAARHRLRRTSSRGCRSIVPAT